MKKVICIALSVCICSVFLCIPCFALVSGVLNSGVVVLSPSYIRAYNPDNSFYTIVDSVPFVMDYSQNSNNVDLSAYGTTSDRTCFNSVLTQSNYQTYNNDLPVYGSNAALGRVQVLYSSVDETGDYFTQQYEFFPLNNSSASGYYSSPFVDDCLLEFMYNDIYVDLNEMVSTSAMSLSYRVYFSSTALDEDYVRNVVENVPLFLDIQTHTTSGIVNIEKNAFFDIVGGVQGGSNNLYYVDCYFDLYSFLIYYSSISDGVVKSNDISYFPSVSVSLSSTTLDGAFDTYYNGVRYDFRGYLFGYNSYVCASDNYVSLADMYQFDNNVNLSGNDFIDWIFNTATSVLGSEFIPGIALGGLLSIVVGLSLGIWVLKVFAGG